MKNVKAMGVMFQNIHKMQILYITINFYLALLAFNACIQKSLFASGVRLLLREIFYFMLRHQGFNFAKMAAIQASVYMFILLSVAHMVF